MLLHIIFSYSSFHLVWIRLDENDGIQLCDHVTDDGKNWEKNTIHRHGKNTKYNNCLRRQPSLSFISFIPSSTPREQNKNIKKIHLRLHLNPFALIKCGKLTKQFPADSIQNCFLSLCHILSSHGSDMKKNKIYKNENKTSILYTILDKPHIIQMK